MKDVQRYPGGDRLDDTVVSPVGQEHPAAYRGVNGIAVRTNEGSKERTVWFKMRCCGVYGARSPFP